MWSDDPRIRKYDKYVFKPSPLKVEDYEYNTWTDFEITHGPVWSSRTCTVCGTPRCSTIMHLHRRYNAASLCGPPDERTTRPAGGGSQVWSSAGRVRAACLSSSVNVCATRLPPAVRVLRDCTLLRACLLIRAWMQLDRSKHLKYDAQQISA
jgi:hypothetical protein